MRFRNRDNFGLMGGMLVIGIFYFFYEGIGSFFELLVVDCFVFFIDFVLRFWVFWLLIILSSKCFEVVFDKMFLIY